MEFSLRRLAFTRQPHGRYPPPGKNPLAVARLVVDSLYHGVALGHYDPGAFVVMANHGPVASQDQSEPSVAIQEGLYRAPGEFDSESYGGAVLAGGVL